MTYEEVLNLWNSYYLRHVCMGTELDNTFQIDDNTYLAEIDKKQNINFYLIDCNRNLDNLIVDDFVYGIRLNGDGVNYKLKRVLLPDSVKVIGDNSFRNCINLEFIDLKNIEYIGSCAFKNTFHLTDVQFSKDLYYIGNRSFEHSGLKRVSFTDCHNIKTLGTCSFSYCPDLKEVIDVYCINEYQYDSEIRNQGVQEGVFKGCKNLEFVSIFNLDNVSKEMFSCCANLKSVDIKQKKIYFCDDSFHRCKNLDFIYGHQLLMLNGFDFCGEVTLYLDKYRRDENGKETLIKYDKQRFKNASIKIIQEEV